MNVDNNIDMHREGIFVGLISEMIYYIKYHNPNISNKEIKEKIVEVLKNTSKENLDYWFDWLGLNEEKLGEDNG